MHKSSDSIALFDSTLFALLLGGIIFVTGYAVSLQMLRSSVVELTNSSVASEIKSINSYIDSRLQVVEEISYSFCLAEDRHRGKFSLENYSEEELFVLFENFLSLHPGICGVALGLNPEQKIYPSQGQYGFAPYVTNVTGKPIRLRLGAMNDYSKDDWFKRTTENNDVFWNPFCKSIENNLVSSFCLPLSDGNNNVIGVFSVDFNLGPLLDKCKEITSVKNYETTVLDSDFRYINHSDRALLLHSAFDDDSELWQAMLKKQKEGEENGIVTGKRNGVDYVLYFSKVKLTGWKICVECPLAEIYGKVNDLKTKNAAVAIFSVLIIALCLIFLYRKMWNAVQMKASLDADMKVAEKLQMGMLPKDQLAFPERKDIDVYGFLKPAKMVGGDLYDYILQDDKFIFCIGDVSGKGVPASMFMSIVVSYFHSNVGKYDSTAEFVSSLNGVLTSHWAENMFCAFFLGILNLQNGRLDYCNAGHDAPILVRNTSNGYEIEVLSSSRNLVIGALNNVKFAEDHATMHPGDSLFMFTDGVTEAENKTHDLFGVEATIDSIKKVYGSDGKFSARDKVTVMLDELHRHTGGCRQSDDITMLLVEYKGTSITLENSIEQLAFLTGFVKDMCGQYGISEEIINDINVAVDEISSNIVRYAFPENETHNYFVSFQHHAGEVAFTFEDDGVPFDPTLPTDTHLDLSPEERPLGGLGIMMVKVLMDKVEYERRGSKNIMRIVKRYIRR
ncbi:MAG: SpoIIE family protein phosphatase [Alistipes sp.]|nr:SpoIIE family protein phosphatase [Candidatus Minthomonas equi]